MSKLAWLVAIPAAAGLVAWNLSLSSEIADLRSRLAEGAPAAAPQTAGAKTSEPRVRETPRAGPQVADLALRVAELEKRVPADPAGAAPSGDSAAGATGTEPSTSSYVPELAYRSDAFKGAVAKVLDERDEARRRERTLRAAEGRTRFLLRDLTVTDVQRQDVQKIVLATMEKVEKVRDDEALPDEQRREQVQALQQASVESLAAVLDPASMETVRQRVAAGMGRRGGDGAPAGGTDGGAGGGRRGGRGERGQ